MSDIVMGVKMDTRKISEGMLKIVELDMEPCYLQAMSIGMLPAPLMEILEKSLGERFDSLKKRDEWGIEIHDHDALRSARREFIKEATSVIARDLIGLASEKGILLV